VQLSGQAHQAGRSADALWAQGLRESLQEGRKRHEAKATHGFRKFHFTKCVAAGLSMQMIDLLRSDSLRGEGDAYYRPTDKEMLTEYKKTIPLLTVFENSLLRYTDAKLARDGADREGCPEAAEKRRGRSCFYGILDNGSGACIRGGSHGKGDEAGRRALRQNAPGTCSETARQETLIPKSTGSRSLSIPHGFPAR
ncbi:MAG: hypothetical protein ACRDF4_12125, partial [Rhabdochlamydiaceae bacterium]